MQKAYCMVPMDRVWSSTDRRRVEDSITCIHIVRTLLPSLETVCPGRMSSLWDDLSREIHCISNAAQLIYDYIYIYIYIYNIYIYIYI